MKKEKEAESSLVKVILVIFLSLVTFSLLSSMFFSNNPGLSGRRMMHGMMGNNYSTNNGVNDLIWGFFSVSMHLLWVFTFVALIFGLVILIKKAFEQKGQNSHAYDKYKINRFQICPQCGDQISDDFKFCPSCTAALTKECNGCGNKVQIAWKCCPYCGKQV